MRVHIANRKEISISLRTENEKGELGINLITINISTSSATAKAPA